MGVRLVCLNDPKSYAGRGIALGRFNLAGLVEGEMADKGPSLVLQVGYFTLQNWANHPILRENC